MQPESVRTRVTRQLVAAQNQFNVLEKRRSAGHFIHMQQWHNLRAEIRKCEARLKLLPLFD